jgi:hypothetical protein
MYQSFVDLFWQTLDMAWYRMETEVSGHVVLAAAFVAILLLLWLFLSPGIKDK